jgi:hypothetical protein
MIVESEAAQDAALFWSVAREARGLAWAGVLASELADEVEMIGLHAASPAVRTRCARLQRELNAASAAA